MKTLSRSPGLLALVPALLLPLRAADQPAAIPPAVEQTAVSAAPTGVETGFVPCKIFSPVRATFPAKMITNGITRGEVQIALEIDTEGKMTDALLVAYSHRGFADEVVRVLDKSRFRPGLVDGQPVVSIVNLTYKFESTGVVAYQRIGLPDDKAEKLNEEFEYRAHGADTIDQPPSGRNLSGPIYPKKWSDEGREGSVTVDFYIDESGRTRMPIAIGTPDDYLAAAAIDAVKEWHFETPRYHGKPTLAHAQQTFVFKLESKSGSGAGI
jgi:TonB family protein